MELNSEPLAFFFTWTTYGSFLQGDPKGWRRWKGGAQQPQPLLAEWRRDRLNYEPVTLAPRERRLVATEVSRLCGYRGWKLWAENVRSNHVHVVVHAKSYNGARVRDQLKANCTRVLRSEIKEYEQRPIWTEGGDWQCINSEDDLELVIQYVMEVQDRKWING